VGQFDPLRTTGRAAGVGLDRSVFPVTVDAPGLAVELLVRLHGEVGVVDDVVLGDAGQERRADLRGRDDVLYLVGQKRRPDHVID
jgi:hypothetical protein